LLVSSTYPPQAATRHISHFNGRAVHENSPRGFPALGRAARAADPPA
jgi:hypothetical protein